jgi:hypothetical protein
MPGTEPTADKRIGIVSGLMRDGVALSSGAEIFPEGATELKPKVVPKMPADVLNVTVDVIEGLLAPLRESMCRTERLLEEMSRASVRVPQTAFSEEDAGENSVAPSNDARNNTPGRKPGLQRGMSMLATQKDFESQAAKTLKTLSVNIRQEKVKRWVLLLAEKFDDAKEPQRSGCLYNFTVSKFFERTTALVIIFNAIFVAVTSDWEIAHIGEDLPTGMQAAEMGFLAYYCIELFCRLAVHRCYFFINGDHKWNIFDFTLVILTIQDMLLFYISRGDDSANLSFMRIFRLAKLAKVLRAVRIFRIFRELSVILESFRRSMVSLFWSCVMLGFALYIFALIFVQGIVGFLSLEGGNVDKDSLEDALKYFGSVSTTIVSLYMAVTGGDDWAVYYDVIERCGMFYSATFLFFTFFFVFALFNILTGIFVEKAVLATQPDRDELILQQCHKSRKEADEFRTLCNRLDTDGSGQISFEEFTQCMQDERMVSYMASVGLEVHDVELFFKIVANTETKDDQISIDQFVEGCMSMRGSASGLDMQKSLYEQTKLQGRLQVMEDAFTSHFAELARAVEQMIPTERPRPFANV